jgi:molybdopterin converting factor subunit 1
MRVQVLYFGVLKDVMGQSRRMMEVAEGSSVAELLAVHRRSVAASIWDSVAVAVNQEYARGGDLLKDGDEVALLPPVSGGRGAKQERNAGVLRSAQNDKDFVGGASDGSQDRERYAG